ncbi:MAG: archaellin/type IV pilin N-terminal domain-containing protein [Nitrososphaerota archaeon]
MKTLYRGIEPIIAVVILVAVTLVIAIGVIGWIMGWWGTLGATENIKVYPDSYINATPPKLYLHIKNEGTAAAVIYKIEIVGLYTYSYSGEGKTVPPGSEDEISLPLNDVTPVPGARYTVRIYTKAGNVYSIVLEAK